ncbi:MAG: DUF5343 domain-containing protein [Anaerolineae bacterium]|jgi:hypothetical protein|nr:DUF5343 domain-containing protein [Anaerolineae bacterium]
MAEFPYINTPNKLIEFFSKIPGMGVPDTVSTNWLPTIGFGSKNYRPIVSILKHIDFINTNGKPTESWRAYRDSSQSKKVMANGIKTAYKELFRLYPDAHKKTEQELKNFFRPKSSGGDQVVGGIVSTFKALCSLADFDTSDTPIPESSSTPHPIMPPSSIPSNSVPTNSVANLSPQNVPQSNSPSLHIDIQIHISSDASAEQIDKIFESMAKHLYQRTKDE